MNKLQLCRHLAKHHNALARERGRPAITAEDVAELLKEMQRLCRQELERTGSFGITGIAKLVVVRRRERSGRDPVSGKVITIPPRRVIRARISSLLRRVIEGPL